MNISHLWARAHCRYQKTMARTFYRRPLPINSPTPLISFTFDDFPRSALLTGGAILKRYGARGTYYASFSLMGQHAPTGPIFVAEDLKTLLEQGHELGCHTFGHCHSWDTEPGVFEDSVLENQRALHELCPQTSFQTFSYPICPPRPETKQRIAKRFACCRGGDQAFNAGTADLGYLLAFFIEQSRGDFTQVKEIIERNRQARGWLVFATHDICKAPTPYGCTPGFFESIVKCAVDSGARILPVAQTLRELGARPSGEKSERREASPKP